MHEDLIGYLLGAIDNDQRRRIEQALAGNPQLREQLEQLRQMLRPLESLADTEPPPPGLVDRTLDLIEQSDLPTRAAPRIPTAPVAVRSFSSSSWTMTDGLVMGLVVLAVFTLLFPALVNSRFEARKTVCQNNLRMLGLQLITFSDRRAEHSFPFVPLSGNRAFAGVFAPTLRDSMLISKDCNWLVCPGSELAEHRTGWYVPSLAEIDGAPDEKLVQLRRQAAGSYAYSTGYFGKDGYRPNRNLGRSYYALVADSPSTYLPGRVSANHAGLGQNICFEDGHVKFVRDPHAMRMDDPLRNRLGYAEAGVDRDDAVVLSSGTRPLAGPLPVPSATFDELLRDQALREMMEAEVEQRNASRSQQ